MPPMESWTDRFSALWAAGTITAEQLDLLETASRRVAERWPSDADADLRAHALGTAVQVVLGDESLEETAQAC